MKSKGLIGKDDIALVKRCMDRIMSLGADAARISMDKTIQSSINFLDGELDKVSFSEESGMTMYIFADGRKGIFDTNSLDCDALDKFISDAVQATTLLAPDPAYHLPERKYKAEGCSDGNELEVYDSSIHHILQERRMDIARNASRSVPASKGRTVSVETEYSDNIDDSILIDSDGFEGRHIETSFGFCAEVTVEDENGSKFSGYHWDRRPFLSDLDVNPIVGKATEKAAAQIGANSVKSGKYDIVVHNCCSSKLISPVISALSGSAIQQHVSFLEEKIGKQVFNRNVTLYDAPHEKGQSGSRLFDFEGAATRPVKVIDHGVLRTYFITSDIADKTGMEQTCDGMSRPCIVPFFCSEEKKSLLLKDILEGIGDGLLVTSFLGGNCNQATGDFSYGIEGFQVTDGRIGAPFRRAVMTGNMIDLWNKIKSAGSDPHPGAMWKIPSLAFEDIDIINS